MPAGFHSSEFAAADLSPPPVPMLGDLKFAFRQFAKSPGFAAVAVLSLALGIGANTAVFSVVNAVLLQMLPVKSPEQLVVFDWFAEDLHT